jgi:1,4-dihydroxy-2-naphthoyl-CoA hydrolase
VDIESFSELGAQRFPGYLGVRVTEARSGRARAELELGKHHLAPNGYLHAGTVVGLADTVCGYGCLASLPEDSSGFTTVELKTNFLGTVLEGTLTAEASMVHGGRTTQSGTRSSAPTGAPSPSSAARSSCSTRATDCTIRHSGLRGRPSESRRPTPRGSDPRGCPSWTRRS